MMGIAILIMTVSGALLAPLALLAVLSGYCMKSEGVVGMLTAGILGEYHVCSKLHAEIVTELLAIVGTIHALSVAETLYTKYSRSSKALKALLLTYRSASWILAWIVLSLAIIHMFQPYI